MSVVSPTPEEAAIREALELLADAAKGWPDDNAYERGVAPASAALDVLVAALRDARRELAEMEWRRDWQYDKAVGWRNRAIQAERERDQARNALTTVESERDAERESKLTARARYERAEAERDQLLAELAAAREHYVRLNEQVTELLSQHSFLERRLAAAREDNARLAIEAATADQDWKRAEQALRRIERNAENNGDEFTRMLARVALGGAAEEET